jgi:carbon storage regulator
MLVLSRKAGETIQIGTDITVTILEIQGNRMKIGISAPPSQRVMRGELVEWQSPAASSAAPIQAGRRTTATAWMELPRQSRPLVIAR